MTRVTARDIQALRLVYDFRFLTIPQARAVIYGNRNVAQRRLSVMAEKGLLNPFPVCRGTRGQPLLAYCINAQQRISVAKLLGTEEMDPANLVRSPPEGGVSMCHLIELNDVLAALMVACRSRGLSLQFIPEYWTAPLGTVCLTDSVQDPLMPRRTVKYRRDAVCCIGSDRGKALFEIEYDRGKESLTASGYRKITLARKIMIFLEALKQRRFTRYSSPLLFDYPFKTSRLLVVTSSQGRALNITQLCRGLDTHGLVYVTSYAEVTEQEALGPIWSVPDGGQTTMKGLVAS